MKKTILSFCAVFIALAVFAGCSSGTKSDKRLQGAWAVINNENYIVVFSGDRYYEVYNDDNEIKESRRGKFSTNEEKNKIQQTEEYSFNYPPEKFPASMYRKTESKPYAYEVNPETAESTIGYKFEEDYEKKVVLKIGRFAYKKTKFPSSNLKELDKKLEIYIKNPNLNEFDVIDGQFYLINVKLDELKKFLTTGDLASFKLKDDYFLDKKEYFKNNALYGRLDDACLDAEGWEDPNFVLKTNTEVSFFQLKEKPRSLNTWLMPNKSEYVYGAVYKGKDVPFHAMRDDIRNSEVISYFNAYMKDGKPAVDIVEIVNRRNELDQERRSSIWYNGRGDVQ